MDFNNFDVFVIFHHKDVTFVNHELKYKTYLLKSVNSNFTLAVHSPKLGQAKTHFLSHHNVCNINRFAKFQTSDLWTD